MIKRHAIMGWLGSFWVLLLSLGLAVPCAGAAEVKATPPGQATVAAGGVGAKAIPAAEPAVYPVYRATGKADPFMPFIEIDLAVKKKKDEDLKKKALMRGTPISPLQQAEISNFRLVGVAGDDQKRTAVVEDGIAKKFYPIFVGTYIGLNAGRVVSIQPDRVIVEERSGTKAKRVQVKRISVMLHKGEEEGKP